MIAENLTTIRKTRGLKMKDVADGIGMKADTYRNYESGRLEPNLSTLEKLADFYGVTTDYLLGRESGEPDTIDKLEREFNMSALEKKILEGYLELSDDMRGNFMEFLQKSVQEIQNND